MHCLDAADARADIRADALTIFLLEIEARVLDGHASRRHSELRVAIHALRLFLIDVVRRVEILDLAGDLRMEALRIEARDAPDAVLALHHGVPERFLARTDRRDGAHACNDYAFIQIDSPLIYSHSAR